MNKRKLTAIIALALAATTLLAACGKKQTPGETAPLASQSAGAPSFASFTATDLEGNQVDQSIFAEHDLTMINIWATFCGPCLREMPELGELNREYADQGVQVVGIVMDVLNAKGETDPGQIDVARDVVAKTGADYLHLLPSMDLINAKLKDVSAVPETIFVDRDGNLVGKSYPGARSKDDWKKIIDETLKELPQKEG